MANDRKPAAAKPKIDVNRTNGALRAAGIDYQVGPDGKFDGFAFGRAMRKRYPRILSKLAVYDRECDTGEKSV